MESQTAVDESQSQAALAEFERRLIEMTQGVNDLLHKEGRKIAVLESKRDEAIKIDDDIHARVLQAYGLTTQAMSSLIHIRTALHGFLDDEFEKLQINEEPCDKVLGVEQKYSDGSKNDTGSQNETALDGSQNETALDGSQNKITLDGSQNEITLDESKNKTALDGSQNETALDESQNKTTLDGFQNEITLHLMDSRMRLHLMNPRKRLHLMDPRMRLHLMNPRIRLHLMNPRIRLHLMDPRLS